MPNAAQERQGAEEAERHRWAQEVLGILHEAALAFAQMSPGLTGAVAEQRCCRGLRFRTLKKFVRVWRPFRRYVLSHDLGCFPTSVEPVLEYVALQARGLAARTWFKDFVNTLRFFEEAGERASEDLLHQLPALQNLTAEATSAAAKRPAAVKPDGTLVVRRGRQAPPMVVAILRAMEAVVVGDDPAFVRLYAWTRLLRHSTAMRWDDTMGVHPSLLVRRARGLFGLLERTKVSGPDRKDASLPIFVGDKAYLAHRWLYPGYDLPQKEFGYKRNYLLPLATPDVQGCIQRRAEYSDAAGYSRALMLKLCVQGRPDEALLTPAAAAFWTDHSERGAGRLAHGHENGARPALFLGPLGGSELHRRLRPCGGQSRRELADRGGSRGIHAAVRRPGRLRRRARPARHAPLRTCARRDRRDDRPGHLQPHVHQHGAVPRRGGRLQCRLPSRVSRGPPLGRPKPRFGTSPAAG